MRQIESRGISYAEISPRLKPDEKGRGLYLKAMLGRAAYQKAYIADVLETLSLETQQGMGALLEDRVPAVVDAVVREGRRGGLSRGQALRHVAATKFGQQLRFVFARQRTTLSFQGRVLMDYPVGGLTAQAASLGAQEGQAILDRLAAVGLTLEQGGEKEEQLRLALEVIGEPRGVHCARG